MPTAFNLSKLSVSASVSPAFNGTDGLGVKSADIAPALSQALALPDASLPVVKLGDNRYAIAASAYVDIDLSAFRHFFNDFLVPQPATSANKAVLVAVFNSTAVPAGGPVPDADLKMGPAPANGFVGDFYGTAPARRVKVQGLPAILFEPAGFADDLTSACLLRLTNLSATVQATATVMVALK